MSAVATLRSRTAILHDQVDAAFSTYRLDDRASYQRFLVAHAQALITAEELLSRDKSFPAGRSRTALLAGDLTVLGSAMPRPLAFAVDAHPACCWGVHYVLEGSRLGGGLLAERVRADFPTRYLRAIHKAGEWRATRGIIEAQATTGGAEWLEMAVAGAQACFGLYLRAAAASPP